MTKMLLEAGRIHGRGMLIICSLVYRYLEQEETLFLPQASGAPLKVWFFQ